MHKFIEDQKLIKFEETSHLYKTLDDKELVSVTTFIQKFSEDFDSDGSILARCALKEGISEKELKKIWLKKGKDAADFGTKFHADIEFFIKNNKIKKNKNAPIIQNFKENYKPSGEVFSESIIFDEDIGIAGCVDIIELHNNQIVVKDFKSNAKKPTDYSFGKNMKYPISHLPDSKLTKYELQISLYLYLLSSKYNYEIGEGNCIYWINRKKNIIEEMPVTLRMDEITAMIAHYLYLKSLSPEELKDLNKPKIISAQSSEPEWVD